MRSHFDLSSVIRRLNPTLLLLLVLVGSYPMEDAHSRARQKKSEGERPSPAENWVEGKVIKVSDGDTVQILESGKGKVPLKIRLYGIDAPEKKQPFGEACRTRLAERVAGGQVRVLLREQDRYGRWIGKVHYSAGKEWKDVGLEMIQVGCAWHYKEFENRQIPEDRVQYARAEESSKGRALGLWKDPGSQAPWAFRKMKRH